MAKFSSSPSIVTQKTVSVTKAIAAAGNYDIEDVLSESTTHGTAWEFSAIARKNGGKGYIIKAQVICKTTAQTPRLTLYLFKAVPTSNLKDNIANTGPINADRANYVGPIDFPGMQDLGGVSDTIATPNTYGNLPIEFECAANSNKLYGILVTRDAITGEVAEDEYTIRLTAEQY